MLYFRLMMIRHVHFFIDPTSSVCVDSLLKWYRNASLQFQFWIFSNIGILEQLINLFFNINYIELVMFKLLLRKCFSLHLRLQNTIGCRWLLMQTQYFRLTSYYWMFCEGYYLHRLLANTFEEQRSLVSIFVIGWGRYYKKGW